MSLLFDAVAPDPVVDRYIDLSFDVSERIIRLLKEKNMSQRDLALLLGKKDSEISKWLRGNHNFTLKTIASIEVALNDSFLQVNGLEPEQKNEGQVRAEKASLQRDTQFTLFGHDIELGQITYLSVNPEQKYEMTTSNKKWDNQLMLSDDAA